MILVFWRKRPIELASPWLRPLKVGITMRLVREGKTAQTETASIFWWSQLSSQPRLAGSCCGSAYQDHIACQVESQAPETLTQAKPLGTIPSGRHKMATLVHLAFSLSIPTLQWFLYPVFCCPTLSCQIFVLLKSSCQIENRVALCFLGSKSYVYSESTHLSMRRRSCSATKSPFRLQWRFQSSPRPQGQQPCGSSLLDRADHPEKQKNTWNVYNAH